MATLHEGNGGAESQVLLENSTSLIRPRCLASLGNVVLGAWGGEGVFLYDSLSKTRTRLGDCESREGELVRCQLLPCKQNVVYAFAGYRNSRKHNGLRLWECSHDSSRAIELDTPLTGFGYAQFKGSDVVWVATGLGKGVARVWSIDLNTGKVSMLASYKAKHSTISSLLFLNDRLVTGTYEACVQEWPAIDSQQEMVELTGRDARVLSKREIRELVNKEFVEDIYNPNIRFDVLHYVTTSSEIYGMVFPLTVMDPHAYQGQMDANNVPHGEGSKLTYDGLLFEGTWVNGSPVTGKLSNNKWEYVGQVQGDDILQHGMGEERRRQSHQGGVEVYSGGWKEGKRHGFGFLQYRDFPKSSSRCGVTQFGFFHEGKPHGLRYNEWDVGATELPFASGAEDTVKRLGKLRSLQVLSNGELIDEFHLSRSDGKHWTKEDKELINVPSNNNKNQPDFFAPNPSNKGEGCGRSTRMECWACLQEEEEEYEFHVCIGCNCRVHKKCAWPPEMFSNAQYGWMCPVCKDRFRSGTQVLVAYDRHGEEVLIESHNDLIDALPAHKNVSFDHAVKLYTL